MRDDTGMREGLYAAIEKAGATRDRGTGKPLVFHELRHTFSTLAVQAFALSDVRAYIGPRGHPDHHALRAHVPQHDAADEVAQLVARASGYQPGTELNGPNVPEPT